MEKCAADLRGDAYVKQVYQRIIYLALLVHISYVALFIWLGRPVVTLYNGGSAAFYLLMLGMVRRQAFRAAVAAIHCEVCLFVAVCTLCLGREAGLPLLLVAMASLVYFCPFAHKYVPYLFSAAEIALFYALKVYTDTHGPMLPSLGTTALKGLYAYNAAICFGIILYAAYTSDLSATVGRRQLQQENLSLEEIANHDQLTGLLSRRHFLALVGQGWRAGAAVAMGDIDDFKLVNDTHGHICGDYVLRTVALLMREHCPQAAVCRWGGEEFIFYFPQGEEARQRLEELRRAIEGYPFVYGRAAFHVTMTFGLAPVQEGCELLQLADLADARMYQGKQQGKNRVV